MEGPSSTSMGAVVDSMAVDKWSYHTLRVGVPAAATSRYLSGITIVVIDYIIVGKEQLSRAQPFYPCLFILG